MYPGLNAEVSFGLVSGKQNFDRHLEKQVGVRDIQLQDCLLITNKIGHKS